MRTDAKAAGEASSPDPATELMAAIGRAREDAREDPFGNPVLSVALWLTRRMDRGEITDEVTKALLGDLARGALLDRAARLRRYVGLDGREAEVFGRVADHQADENGFRGYKAAVGARRYAAVFTAHPTFGMGRSVGRLLASMASEPDEARRAGILDETPPETFRPDPGITLRDEFERARDAVRGARDAMDELNTAFYASARRRWPDRWTEIDPAPIALGSWVGCDTDGRTDIGWWDTLGYRLESKRTLFGRILEKLPPGEAAAEVRRMAQAALDAVERQLVRVPPFGAEPALGALHDFALSLVGEREAALTDAAPLIAALDRAVAESGTDEERLAFCLMRAGCRLHGVSIALPHFRLNASQLHNAMRQAIQLDGSPDEPAQRRAYLTAINAALDDVQAVPVDYGSLAAERASATRMLMTIAQLVKHVDGSHPVRFLVAETETGYTLLSALYLACRFGIADRIEISPLFETGEALEGGPRIIDEALRSPHFCAYLRRQGRFCVQFGYSDSGRYVGQAAASFWIERLRLRISELLVRYGLGDIELVIFDTHGESVGRGAHPDSLGDRLAYLDPPHARQVFAEAGIKVVEETSFQGSDGYLFFDTPELARATIGRVAEHVFAEPARDQDPIYAEPDFSTEFFQTLDREMTALVDDPGYAALIGTFGPSLLDKTGSRPAARQSDMGGPARITHPRELRAIPNNAILHQLGWLANSVHGIGHAAARAPEMFGSLKERSDRFDRTYRLVEGAMRSSDLDVLRGYIDTLDPGSWFDRARRTAREGRRDELLGVATALARLDLAPSLRRLFGRLSTDWLRLRGVVGETPRMSVRLAALHALRLAVIHKIWLTATHIPDFRPQSGVTREMLMERILRLDVPSSLTILEDVFPLRPDPTVGLDFGEPPGPRETGAYAELHRDVFEPIRRRFDLVREITGAIQHEIGAFG